MKRIICNTIFLVLLLGSVSAQEGERGPERWRKILPEQKMPRLDTTLHVLIDSVPKRAPIVPPVEIPNVYSRRVEDTSKYRMPVVRLSGKYSVPMPGTENLDKMENNKSPIKK